MRAYKVQHGGQLWEKICLAKIYMEDTRGLRKYFSALSSAKQYRKRISFDIRRYSKGSQRIESFSESRNFDERSSRFTLLLFPQKYVCVYIYIYTYKFELGWTERRRFQVVSFM